MKMRKISATSKLFAFSSRIQVPDDVPVLYRRWFHKLCIDASLGIRRSLWIHILNDSGEIRNVNNRQVITFDKNIMIARRATSIGIFKDENSVKTIRADAFLP